MVNCSVISCKRSSITSNLKEHGISYHTFPKSDYLKEKWIKFCGQKEGWVPKTSSVICSEHFGPESFKNKTKSNKRNLNNGAVPIIKLPDKVQKVSRNKAFISITRRSPVDPGLSNSKDGNMSQYMKDTREMDLIVTTSLLQICRICLAKNKKMYEMKLLNLTSHYNQLIGLNVINNEDYPQVICWECYHRLRLWFKFRKKALITHRLMTEVLEKEHILTPINLCSIDREKNDLISHLEVQEVDTVEIENQPNLDELSRAVVHKPIIDPLSDFVYDEDEAISVTDSDDSEFLAEYEEILKMEEEEKAAAVGEKKKEDPVTNFDIKLEVVKCEDLDDSMAAHETDGIFVKSDGFDDSHHGFDDDDDDVINADDDDDDDKNLLEVARKKSLEKVTSKSESVRKIAGKGRRMKRKNVQMKPLKKEPKPKRVPKMTRQQRSELYFDKNFIEIVNISMQDAINLVEKRKDSENYKDADFKCFECFKGFCDKDVYDTHMEYHSDKRGEFECHVCKVRFANKIKVKKHLNNHLLNYACKLCGFTTKSRIGAKRHSEYHKKGTLYKCPHCEQKFEKHTSYLGHIRKKHPSDIVCVLCGGSFVSLKGLEHHKKLKHRFDEREVSEDGPLCEECNIRFFSEEALMVHIHKKHNLNHGNDKDENDSPDRSNRLQERTEKGPRSGERDRRRMKCILPSKPKKKIKKPLKCEQCGLELSTIRAYYWHFRKEHPDKTRTQYFLGNNKYMCEICGRFFQKADILDDHILTHTGVKIYKCDRCGKAFNTNLSLTIHMKIHDVKRKRHACPVCGKTFLRSNNLKRHEYLHTGLRPFACDMCGKCFPTNSERKTHVEHAHFKKPWPKRNRAKEPSDEKRRQAASNASTVEMPPPPHWVGEEEEAHVSKYLYM